MESATNTLTLIELVKNCPQIYDASRSDFKLPLQKDLAWTNIAMKLQTTDDECRKRWRTLRERYTRELRRMKTHKSDPSNPAGSEVLGAAAWNLYNEMSFLQDHVKLRKTRSSFERSTLQIKPDDAEDNVIDSSEEVYAKFKISKIEDANNQQGSITVIEHYRDDPLSHGSSVQDDHIEQHIDDDGGIQVIDDNTIDDGVSYITSDEPPVNSRIMLTVRPSNSSLLAAASGSHVPSSKHIKRKFTTMANDEESMMTSGNIECDSHNKATMMSYQQQLSTEHQLPHHQQSHHQQQSPQQQQQQQQQQPPSQSASEEDFFCRAVACTLKGLSRVHSMKAKVEIYQVLAKYTELEEN